MSTEFVRTEHGFTVDDVPVTVAAIGRGGNRTPVVMLHGFGSTKEDYADIVRYVEHAGRPFLAYDAPGCGESHCADLDRISIPFLVGTALSMLDSVGIDRFHLVGHSMGGLTGLMLADGHPERVLSFTSIEGNIAPEDCFLSRQILEHADPDPEAFMNAFVARTLHTPSWASALYSASLRHKVRAGAVRGIFTSIVDLSDNAGLMDRFLALPSPTMFMYGEQNDTLSYLAQIQAQGVRLAEIPHCGHFPMYSNPPAMWKELAAFWGSD